MYDVRPNLIIGFHGCDETVSNALLNDPDKVKISKQPYDWLGNGMYFWENNYERALSWANDKKKRSQIDKPAVIGAVINLGYCCDFLDSKHIRILEPHYSSMVNLNKNSGTALPRNKDSSHDLYKDKVLRELDCSVIEFMHRGIYHNVQADIDSKGYATEQPFDSVRGVFMEGGPAFEGSGIFEKNHIQICIRNPNCIKGFFRPRQKVDYMQWYLENFSTKTGSASVTQVA
ncbi:hypothetical protein SAMN05518672_102401 [Chitinophaga sp. CF118]|uniref:hypothetical protein n=1 Tax=Chitinophaga sp. CF118 TaxID=1884367 RepID=UPI0008F26B47|nr:hypothetical protein [Chitinophaga sp. CF118]SFD55380.1 hypothetical protein SAMN05518672_102401 [Chitinophaga sp. CF118]